MNLFDELVNSILRNQSDILTLRPVVEKEILHHEILRILSQEGLLKNLAFMGGTCLRDCYGSPRLSEDLDFAGDVEFQYSDLKCLGNLIKARVNEKYGFAVDVSEPRREEGDTRTWKIRVKTRPESSSLPAQRIHIDICNIPSLNKVPNLLQNHYAIDLGTSGLIIQTETMEEILADKYTALALRLNRIKNRDIWDIVWLKQKNITCRKDWVFSKAESRGIGKSDYLEGMAKRINELEAGHDDFLFEIKRFLPARMVSDTYGNPDWWIIVNRMIREEWGL